MATWAEKCVCECGREICLPAVGQWRQLCAWLASQSVLSDVPEERWESGANDLFDLFSSPHFTKFIFHHIRVFHNKQTSSCSLCAGQRGSVLGYVYVLFYLSLITFFKLCLKMCTLNIMPHSKYDFESLQNQYICKAAMSDGRVKLSMTSYTVIIKSFYVIAQ